MTTLALRLPHVRVPRPVVKFLSTVKPAFLVRREADHLVRHPESTLYMGETFDCLNLYRIVPHAWSPLPTFSPCFRSPVPTLAHRILKRKLRPGQAEALRRTYGRVN